MLLRLVLYGPLSGLRLPGDRVSANLSDETLSGRASVNETRRMGQVLLVATEGTPSLLRALPRTKTAPKMNTSNMFDVDNLL
jgi:hypothetical protein